MRHRLERLTGLMWGTARCPAVVLFTFAPAYQGRSYVDLQVGLFGRSFYVTRIPT